MKTSDVVAVYVGVRRAQGVQMDREARRLRQFARETGDRPLQEVRPQDVAAFLRGHGDLSAAWVTKYRNLKGLYRFALARGLAGSSPLPKQLPKLPPPLTPYVYSRDELQRLLDATAVVASPCSRLQALTYRTLLLLLYGAALRVSEAINLTLHDVDLDAQMLTIRNTKFYKTRLVPIGQDLTSVLSTYAAQRRVLALPQGEDSALLCSRTGNRLHYQDVVTLFQRIRAAAGIGCPTGERWPPRLHDLRHTAAAHRVVAWYRQGKDVQQLLPYLSTYLGHANINSTQRYLQMVPELLQEASLRFARYAGQDDQEEHHA
jgi:site-specific recombinase XerD